MTYFMNLIEQTFFLVIFLSKIDNQLNIEQLKKISYWNKLCCTSDSIHEFSPRRGWIFGKEFWCRVWCKKWLRHCLCRVSGSSNISESDDGKRSESMDSSKSFFLEPNLLESLLFFSYQLIAVLACIRLVYVHVR